MTYAPKCPKCPDEIISLTGLGWPMVECNHCGLVFDKFKVDGPLKDSDPNEDSFKEDVPKETWYAVNTISGIYGVDVPGKDFNLGYIIHHELFLRYDWSNHPELDKGTYDYQSWLSVDEKLIRPRGVFMRGE